MDKYIGKRLDGRYEIQELVGVGGMANVYRALDVSADRTVAVKILRDEFATNEELVRRFRNESKAIAVLFHPNIVKVYDVNFTSKVHYIVMEYIDGITLKEYIEQKHVLPWKEAVFFTEQILRALQHAHEKGIVHRDVKPQNIMLLSDGSIKVTDFGIARFARSGHNTITDRALGSVHYISPEQAQGEQTDGKADIYSVGVMLYEMTTGELPFVADSPLSVALKQIQARARQPRTINPTIPEGLEEITLRAMEKDPADRYQTAEEMLRDIDAFKHDPSISFEYKYLGQEPVIHAGEGEEHHPHHRRMPVDSAEAAAVLTGGHSGENGAKKEPKSVRKRIRKTDRNPAQEAGGAEKPLPILPVMAGITAAFVVGSAIFIFSMIRMNNPFVRVEEVEVPSLVGQKFDMVRTGEGYSDFIIEAESAPEFNDQYEKGTIFDQKPSAGRTVKVGSKITVKVSAGQEIITLPAFVNQEATSVFGQLRDMNLEYQQVEVFSNTIPSGYVTATEPGKGSQVPAGTVVRVMVSMGSDAEVVEVPDVGGYSLEDARQILTDWGLGVGSIEYKESESEAGTVIGQSPGPNSQIEEGAYVNLTLSSGDQIINQLPLYVKLPTSISSVINISAMQDGEVVIHNQQIQPSLVRVWKPTFVGEGVSNIQIIIDNQLYMEYEMDFTEGTSRVLRDNSADFD